jgi:serine/threonine protein kinase
VRVCTTFPSQYKAQYNTKRLPMIQTTSIKNHMLTAPRADSEPQSLPIAASCWKGGFWQGSHRGEEGYRYGYRYSYWVIELVLNSRTGLTFALKYIRKDEVVRSESVRNILRERRMLEHLNYQFICNLRYSFQDIEYM